MSVFSNRMSDANKDAGAYTRAVLGLLGDRESTAEFQADLRAVRRLNLRFLRGLDRDELKRFGVHSERGEESVEHMIRLYAGHDQLHVRQLRRILGRPND